MTKKEFQNKYSPKYDEITINGVTISYDCYEINVEDGKDVVCFYNEGGYCFMCSIPLEDVDLINRQQKQLENYSHKVRTMAKDICRYKAKIDRLKDKNLELLNKLLPYEEYPPLENIIEEKESDTE